MSEPDTNIDEQSPPPKATTGDVGVRELRQNLSVYLDRVKRGEELTVTERGRPVARLTPLVPGGGRILDVLVAQGLAIPPSVPGGVSAMVSQPARPGAPPLSELLREMRDEERY